MEIKQRYEIVRLDGDEDVIRPHPRNPNHGDDGVVAESVDENGWYGAVIAQESTGYILAGHTRWRVALQKNAKEIPVIWKDVDDETALKILLVDNESARHAWMDEAVLEELLQGLDTLSGTGYALASVQEKLQGDADDERLVEGFESDSDLTVSADDVPDDVYTPEFGVMIVCDSEKQQEKTYEWLQKELPKRTIRVVAV